MLPAPRRNIGRMASRTTAPTTDAATITGLSNFTRTGVKRGKAYWFAACTHATMERGTFFPADW